MGRKVMDGGFRRIKTAPVVAEPQPDARLALVDLFAASHIVPVPEPVPAVALITEEPVDLSSMDSPALADLFTEDAQEPADEPVADTRDAAPEVVHEAVHEAPAQPEPVVEPVAPESESKDNDYDPIAAVLG